MEVEQNELYKKNSRGFIFLEQIFDMLIINFWKTDT